MVLGHGDSISYDQLVQRITGDTLDKSNRFTDWTRRPLSPAQITYAISDVTHLRDVYTALVADLGRRGRTDWMGDEMEVLTSPETYRADPERAWMRLKTRVRKPKDLAVLIEVAAWREREAQSRDVPRSRVLKDDIIGDIATQAPTTPERLDRCARCRKASSGRNGAKELSTRSSAALLAIQRAAANRTAENFAERRGDRRASQGPAADDFGRHGVAAKVIATVDDLDRIAGNDEADVPALKGWRRELFGERALDLKHGRLALAIERSRVVAVERA